MPADLLAHMKHFFHTVHHEGTLPQNVRNNNRDQLTHQQGPSMWPPCSPDLICLDLYVWTDI